MTLLIFIFLGIFSIFLLLLTSCFILLWLEKILCIISILLNLLRFILWIKPGLSQRMLHVHLRRMHILRLLCSVHVY